MSPDQGRNGVSPNSAVGKMYTKQALSPCNVSERPEFSVQMPDMGRARASIGYNIVVPSEICKHPDPEAMGRNSVGFCAACPCDTGECVWMIGAAGPHSRDRSAALTASQSGQRRGAAPRRLVLDPMLLDPPGSEAAEKQVDFPGRIAGRGGARPRGTLKRLPGTTISGALACPRPVATSTLGFDLGPRSCWTTHENRQHP